MLYRQYRAHLHYSKPIDRECMRAYQLLAQSQLVIKALESIVAAGLNAQGSEEAQTIRA
jgi:tryptophan synthase beta subunit